MGASKIGKVALICLILSILTPIMTSLAVDEITDNDITAAAQKRMAADGKAQYVRVNVETKEGIMKLSGPVDNVLAKEKAVEIAKSIRGVRSVIDMIHFDAPKRDDKEIHRDIMNALEKDPAVDHPDIDVKVEKGAVVLSGTVDSFTEKHLAQRVAMGVKGVIGVKNRIQIEQRSGRSDDEIKADIEGRFRDNVLVNHELIKVQVKNGDVKLTGSVGNVFERLRARGFANSTSGVKSTDMTQLVIDRSQADDMWDTGYAAAGSDESIRNALRDAFIYDTRVDHSRISIEIVTPTTIVDQVRLKHVILTGTVDNPAMKWAAEEDAMNTIGVSLVQNHLTAASESSVSDVELLDRVKKALLSDSGLGSFSLKLSVLNGEVHLSGTVDSDSSKQHAEDIVNDVEGVVSVQNDLKIGG